MSLILHNAMMNVLMTFHSIYLKGLDLYTITPGFATVCLSVWQLCLSVCEYSLMGMVYFWVAFKNAHLGRGHFGQRSGQTV